MYPAQSRSAQFQAYQTWLQYFPKKRNWQTILLLGLDCLEALGQEDNRWSRDGCLLATHTPLGYAIIGNCAHLCREDTTATPKYTDVCHSCEYTIATPNHTDVCHSCEHTTCQNTQTLPYGSGLVSEKAKNTQTLPDGSGLVSENAKITQTLSNDPCSVSAQDQDH